MSAPAAGAAMRGGDDDPAVARAVTRGDEDNPSSSVLVLMAAVVAASVGDDVAMLSRRGVAWRRPPCITPASVSPFELVSCAYVSLRQSSIVNLLLVGNFAKPILWNGK